MISLFHILKCLTTIPKVMYTSYILRRRCSKDRNAFLLPQAMGQEAACSPLINMSDKGAGLWSDSSDCTFYILSCIIERGGGLNA